jgi:hypothetical protein
VESEIARMIWFVCEVVESASPTETVQIWEILIQE